VTAGLSRCCRNADRMTFSISDAGTRETDPSLAIRASPCRVVRRSNDSADRLVACVAIMRCRCRFSEIVYADGKVLEGETTGNLCLTRSWPAKCARSTVTKPASSRPIYRPTRGRYFSGGRLPAGYRRILLDHRPCRRGHQRFRMNKL